MRRRRTDRQESFSPLQDKTLASVLRHLFVTEFGYDKKVLFAEAMIGRILEVLQCFTRSASLLKPGQLLWMAVANDGHKHAYQAMKDTPQVPVLLDLVTDGELQSLADGQGFAQVRHQRHARLLDQALDQGGVLAQSDLAAITLMSCAKVRGDIRQVERAEGRLLPYRGCVQDLGATVSHRVEVARLLEAGYLEPDICRMLSPAHDLKSVENYAKTYKNILKLLERGFTPTEISGILSIGKRLVKSYVDIVRDHHPALVVGDPQSQEQPSCST